MTQGNLTWKVAEESDALSVQLTGAIDEDSDLSSLKSTIEGSERICFNLGGVSRINSVGVREWVNFMRDLGNQIQLSLRECSPVIVSQLNMIANFSGSACVHSVYAPYVCDECGAEDSVLIDVESIDDVEDLAERRCPKCGEQMELDDLPGSYFSFAKR